MLSLFRFRVECQLHNIFYNCTNHRTGNCLSLCCVILPCGSPRLNLQLIFILMSPLLHRLSSLRTFAFARSLRTSAAVGINEVNNNVPMPTEQDQSAFYDSQTAYGAKTTRQLQRALLVLRLCQVPAIVQSSRILAVPICVMRLCTCYSSLDDLSCVLQFSSSFATPHPS